jgi:hypothetical protein
MKNPMISQTSSKINAHFSRNTCLLFIFRVISQEEENKSEKTNFWQRFRAKKKDKKISEAVSIRSLVNKNYKTL